MKLDELIRFTGLFLEEEGVDYYVFGATAMNFWVPPRNTVDLDVVLCVEKRRAVALVGKLRKNAIRIPSDLLRKLTEGRLIKIPLGDSELDLKLGRSPHEREALLRAKTFVADDFRLRICVPEDIVLFKLQAWRRQDQADLERLLERRKDLDTTYVESWLIRLSEATGLPLRDRWSEIRNG
jgi:hypothetical protein